MKYRMKSITKMMLMFILTATVFTACKKDNDDAKVAVKLTDDPFPMGMVAKAEIGVAKIELKDANGNYVTVFEGDSQVNMVDYTNGATAEVNVESLPEGTYNEAKITLNAASVTLTNNEHFDASASVNHSYTVRVNPAIEVTQGNTEDLLLDLDLSDTFRFSGSFMGGWFNSVADITGIGSCHPDFRAVSLSHTGSVEGQVVDANGNGVAYAYVSVSYDYDGDGHADSVSTICDANGHYAIIGLPEGTYTVEVEADHHANVDVSNVSVNVQHETTVNVTVN